MDETKNNAVIRSIDNYSLKRIKLVSLLCLGSFLVDLVVLVLMGEGIWFDSPVSGPTYTHVD